VHLGFGDVHLGFGDVRLGFGDVHLGIEDVQKQRGRIAAAPWLMELAAAKPRQRVG
jgi:hypothetical protein